MYSLKDECAKCKTVGLFEDCPPKDKIAKWRKERGIDMAKAILVMDMPKNCNECDLLIPTVGKRYMCAKTKWRVSDAPVLAGVPNNCPLIPAIGYIEAKGNMISWEDEE